MPSTDRTASLLDALLDALLDVTPHVVVRPADDGSTVVWASARGLSARRVAAGVLAAARARLDEATQVRVGVARVAIAAEIAARTSQRTVTGVAPRQERAFLAGHPLGALLDTGAWPDDVRVLALRRTVSALADLGVRTCGELADLAPDAVAVRFGAVGAVLWRLARADDPRRLFTAIARTLPSASLEWTTYELRDPERLAFVAHRLVTRVIDEMERWGDAARTLVLRFALAGGGAHETIVRGARASAEAASWSRLVRAALERVTLDDGVIGLALRVEAATRVDAPQGDLFDRGFQSGAAAEAAVSRLMDDGAGMPVALAPTGDPLPERRMTRRTLEFREVAHTLRRTADVLVPNGGTLDGGTLDGGTLDGGTSNGGMRDGDRVLSLQGARARRAAAHVAERQVELEAWKARVDDALALRLLPEPRPVVVTTRRQRGARVPVRYRERLPDGERAPHGRPLVEIVTALGPDRVRIGQMTGAPVGREYWQCLTSEARLVLLYEDTVAAPDASPDAPPDDAEHGTWFLQGWWD